MRRSLQRRLGWVFTWLTVHALLGLAAAQVVATAPVGSSAVITLSGEVQLSPSLLLSASRTELLFDLSPEGWGDNNTICVEGGSEADVELVPAFPGAQRVNPAGTVFQVTAHPDFVIDAVREISYTADLTDAAGRVVCYQTFTLDFFSNVSGWNILVNLVELRGVAPLSTVYLAAFCPGGPPAEEGMLRLQDGDYATLLRGANVAACNSALVAVAVRPDPSVAGELGALLTYTLLGGEGSE